MKAQRPSSRKARKEESSKAVKQHKKGKRQREQKATKAEKKAFEGITKKQKNGFQQKKQRSRNTQPNRNPWETHEKPHFCHRNHFDCCLAVCHTKNNKTECQIESHGETPALSPPEQCRVCNHSAHLERLDWPNTWQEGWSPQFLQDWKLYCTLW